MSQVKEEEKESLARTQLPYRAEYCKTNRARCKKCNEPMLANSLKIASSTKSRFHDGLDYHYHHINCFFRVKRPSSVAEIAHYESLKYDDQKMLEKAIETKGQSVFDGGSNDEAPTKIKGKKASKRETAPQALVNYDDFLIEYAKSSRSTCIKCEAKIEKSLVRIGKLDYNAETAFKGGPIPRWYHMECFAKSLEKVEFDGDISLVKGFVDLKEEDQKLLKASIKPAEKSVQVDAKKAKKEDEEDHEEEVLLRKQSDRFFRLRERVAAMKRKDIELMLKNMDQKHDHKNSGTLVDMATDVLMFGPLKGCPQCTQKGHIQLRASRYICTGILSDGSPCTYETIEPSRGAPDVPDEVVDSYDFFEKYKFKGGKRLFPRRLLKAIEEKESENNGTVMDDGPLEGLTIGITSWQAIDTDKTRVQKKITSLGGKLVTALDRSLFVILSSESELEKDTPKIEVAKALNVPFATEEFLFKVVSKKDVAEHVSKCLIKKWDGDLKERFEKFSSSATKD